MTHSPPRASPAFGSSLARDEHKTSLPTPTPTDGADPLELDKVRLDWLEQHDIEVRDSLVYGSRHMFFASVDDSIEGEIGPSDIRAKIDHAMLSSAPPADGKVLK